MTLNILFCSQTSLLIPQFLTDGVAWIFFNLQSFLTPMKRPGFKPTPELHQTGTFWTLYRLSYTAAATLIKLLRQNFEEFLSN